MSLSDILLDNDTDNAPAPDAAPNFAQIAHSLTSAIGSHEWRGRNDPSTYTGVNKIGAIGRYQFMPTTLAEDSRKYLGRMVSPDEFRKNPSLQDQLAYDRTLDHLQQNYQKDNGNLNLAIRDTAIDHYGWNGGKINAPAPGGGEAPIQYANTVMGIMGNVPQGGASSQAPQVSQSSQSLYAGLGALIDSASKSGDPFAAPPAETSPLLQGNYTPPAPPQPAPPPPQPMSLARLPGFMPPTAQQDVLKTPGYMGVAAKSYRTELSQEAQQNEYNIAHHMGGFVREEYPMTDEEKKQEALSLGSSSIVKGWDELKNGQVLSGALSILGGNLLVQSSNEITGEGGILPTNVAYGLMSSVPLVARGLESATGAEKTTGHTLADLIASNPNDKIEQQGGQMIGTLAEMSALTTAIPGLSAGAAFVLPSVPDRIANIAEAFKTGNPVEQFAKETVGAGIDYATGQMLESAATVGSRFPLPRFGQAVTQGALFGASAVAQSESNGEPIELGQVIQQAGLGALFGALHADKGAVFYNSPERARTTIEHTPLIGAFGDALPVSPEITESPIKVGDSVNPLSAEGDRIFAEPKRVTDVQEKDGVRYIQVEGGKSYVPESQIERPSGTPEVTYQYDPIVTRMIDEAKASGDISPEIKTEHIPPMLAEIIRDDALKTSLAEGLQKEKSIPGAVEFTAKKYDMPKETANAVLSHPDIAPYLPPTEPISQTEGEQHANTTSAGQESGQESQQQVSPESGTGDISELAGIGSDREQPPEVQEEGNTNGERDRLLQTEGQIGAETPTPPAEVPTEPPAEIVGEQGGTPTEEASAQTTEAPASVVEQPTEFSTQREDATEATQAGSQQPESPEAEGKAIPPETVSAPEEKPAGYDYAAQIEKQVVDALPVNDGSSGKDIRDYAIKNRVPTTDAAGNNIGWKATLKLIREDAIARARQENPSLFEPPSSAPVSETPTKGTTAEGTTAPAEHYFKVPSAEEDAKILAGAKEALPRSENDLFDRAETDDRFIPKVVAKMHKAFDRPLRGKVFAESAEEGRPIIATGKEAQRVSRSSYREVQAEARRNDAIVERGVRAMRSSFNKLRDRDSRMAFYDYYEKNPEHPTTAEDVARHMYPDGNAQQIAKGARAVEATADFFHKNLDEVFNKQIALDRTKLLAYTEDYLSRLYKNPNKAADYFRRTGDRYSTTSTGHLKQRTYTYHSDALRAGLEDRFDNVIDTFLQGYHQQNEFVAMQSHFEGLKKQGIVKYIRPGEPIPFGYAALKDARSIVYGAPMTPVISFFDQGVRNQLEGFAQKFGVDIRRGVNPAPLGESTGAMARGDKIYIRHAAGNELLTHEIGHIIDDKFGIYDKLTKGTEGKQIKGELQNLSDERLVGHEDADEQFKDYVRSPDEQVANLLHAYVHAPDVLERVAPMAKARFEQIAEANPALRPVLDIKPTLQIGSETMNAGMGGRVTLGQYYAPSPVARDLNELLKPGLGGNTVYRSLRGINNLVNQISLSLSAFHAMMSSLNLGLSSGSTGLLQMIYGEGVKGKAKGALNILKGYTVLPVLAEGSIKGAKIRKAWIDPEYYKAHPEAAKVVDAIIEAGGDATTNPMYRTHMNEKIRDMINDPSLLSILKGTGAAIGKIPQWLSNPIMEHLVPTLKTAAFAQMLDEANMHTTDTPLERQERLQRSWRSVDNRFGQLIYDNLFWNKAAKDLAMLGVRSVGWNIGTIGEIGGGLKDYAKAGADIFGMMADKIRGKETIPPEFTQRMAYTLMLPMMVGTWGAIINKILTGENPQNLLDYFYPRTGKKTETGEDERLTLPTYMRDVVGYYKHPLTTVGNKLSPVVGLVHDLTANKDYSGELITSNNMTNPVALAADYGKFIAQYTTPFSIQNIAREVRGGRKLGQFETIAPELGFTPPPMEMLRSDFENYAHDLSVLKNPPGSKTHKELETQRTKYQIMAKLRTGNYDEAKQMASDAGIGPSVFADMERDSKIDPLILRLRHMSIDDIQGGLQYATPDEKAKILPQLESRINNNRTMTEADKESLRKKYGFPEPQKTPAQLRTEARRQLMLQGLGGNMDEYDRAVKLRQLQQERKERKMPQFTTPSAKPSGINIPNFRL